MTILWSKVIEVFGAEYDNVFGSAGRKAYFDFNRVKSKTIHSVTDNVIDGAKETWKLPMLMDAIACCYFNIQHNAYRQKSRKFNQHDLLIQIIHGICASADATDQTLYVDVPGWTSFENLKKEFSLQPPKKNIEKYVKITSMFLCNDEMGAVGLLGVLKKIAETCLSIDLAKLDDRSLKYYDQDVISDEGSNTSKELRASLPIYNDAEFAQALARCRSQSSSDSFEEKTSSLHSLVENPILNGKKRKQMYPEVNKCKSNKVMTEDGSMSSSKLNLYESQISPVWSPSSSLHNVIINSDLQFSVRAACNSNLQKLFGDGKIISFAVATSENADIILVDKVNEYEWIFRAIDHDSATKILCCGQFRVLGISLAASSVLPSI